MSPDPGLPGGINQYLGYQGGCHLGQCHPVPAGLPSQVDTLLRSVSTNLTAAPPIEWIATLTQELTWARQANRDLTDEVTGLRDDLDAARRALRRMIKNTATDPHG